MTHYIINERRVTNNFKAGISCRWLVFVHIIAPFNVTRYAVIWSQRTIWDYVPMTNEAYWQAVLSMTEAWKLGMKKAQRAIEIDLSKMHRCLFRHTRASSHFPSVLSTRPWVAHYIWEPLVSRRLANDIHRVTIMWDLWTLLKFTWNFSTCFLSFH